MAKHVKGLVVNRPARDGEDAAAMAEKAAALNLVARKAGFSNYQQMTVWFWNRVILAAGERLDAFPAIEGEIRSIVDKAADALARGPRRPK